MRDSARQEEWVCVHLLLCHLRKQGVAYAVKTRPDQDETEPGTYDFLCVPEVPGEPALAVEVTRFMENGVRKAFDLQMSGVARDLVSGVGARLPGTFDLYVVGSEREVVVGVRGQKGRLARQQVPFHELGRRRQEIVRGLEQAILQIVTEEGLEPGEQRLIQQPLLCDLVKTSHEGSALSAWMDFYDSDMPRDMAHGGSMRYLCRSLGRALRRKNEQLSVPKRSGKKTALILNADPDDPLARVYATPRNLRWALSRQADADWENIDDVYLRRGQTIFLVASRN